MLRDLGIQLTDSFQHCFTIPSLLPVQHELPSAAD
jgi:hypothetical protein